MSKLSIEDVEHIAKLSRLKLSDTEKKKFSKQLSSILDYVGQLNEVDTKNVEITAQVTGLKNVYVDDEITNPEAPESLLNNSPELEDRAIKVPGVFSN
jgi:aspartyl-tRNA(Asn)/glutamyl-tRNA(Gln) amidotransferase subunit C